MKVKIIIGGIIIFFTLESQAGVAGLTIHSRANCLGNNESISWHAGHSYYLSTFSDHTYKNGSVHRKAAQWEKTWRSAGVCWDESWTIGNYSVVGNHYMHRDGGVYKLGKTVVADCSIYDGWWD